MVLLIGSGNSGCSGCISLSWEGLCKVLISWKTDNANILSWKVSARYYRKKYVSSEDKLYYKCVVIDDDAIYMDILPNEIRGLWSAPETENWMGCSGGMGESE